MRIKKQYNGDGRVSGYTMYLSAADTLRWCEAWPCSNFKGESLRFDVDRNGLCDLRAPKDADGYALDAIAGDFLPADCQHLWPTWGA